MYIPCIPGTILYNFVTFPTQQCGYSPLMVSGLWCRLFSFKNRGKRHFFPVQIYDFTSMLACIYPVSWKEPDITPQSTHKFKIVIYMLIVYSVTAVHTQH